MKLRWLIIVLLAAQPLRAADLPTITVEHLYYLEARAERVRRFRPDEMVDYCIAQKIGGGGFDSLYAQLFAYRTELTKLLAIEGAEATDSRVASLNRTVDAYTKLLQQEAQRVQNEITREGQIATDTLQNIATAQNARK